MTTPASVADRLATAEAAALIRATEERRG